MIDDLPPLPAALRPDPCIEEHCPRALAVDGSHLIWQPKSKAQQHHRGNPDFLQDQMIWMIGVEPIERAVTMVNGWMARDLVSDEFSEVLLALLEMRAAREAGKTPFQR